MHENRRVYWWEYGDLRMDIGRFIFMEKIGQTEILFKTGAKGDICYNFGNDEARDIAWEELGPIISMLSKVYIEIEGQKIL